MKEHLSIPADRIGRFIKQHRLTERFRETVETHYSDLARHLPGFRPAGRPLLLGISGAQGTGKSTLADFLDMASRELHDWRCAVLSIDDFYLTRAAREAMAQDTHPLFRTRGVPGTHDTDMLGAALDCLVALQDGESASLPRFDKSVDDRAPRSDWPVVTGPIDMIILEGWCVGSRAQSAAALATPVNALEQDEDPDAIWRGYANESLRTEYEPLFDRLDALVFLAAPSIEAIFRWRLEQEQKLAAISSGCAIMDESSVARFIRFYERLTRHNLAILPEHADVVLTLDERHVVTKSRYRHA